MISIKPVHGPHHKHIARIEEIHQVSAAQFSKDLYTICRWMQDNKHYGVSLSDIQDNDLPEYIVTINLPLPHAYEGILYYSSNPKFYGWGINKNNILKSDKYEVWKWEQTWLEKFGYLHPERAAIIQKTIDAINHIEEAKPKRSHDLHWLERYDTVQVAHLRELSKLMAIWMFSFRRRWGLGDDSFTYLQNVWERQAFKFTQELEYRTAAEPEPRRSKKKTAAAKQDFREAALWLTGVNRVFSEEFIEMVKGAALPFDLTVDYDNLPKLPPEQAPVMKMNERQLMHEFMRWISNNEIDPDSFEGEDALLLKQRLYKAIRTALDDERKTLARMKNQHVPTEEITE